MTTQTNKGLSVRRQRTELVPREGLVFVALVYGPNNYFKIKTQIEQDNLKTPTQGENVDLIHAAFNSDDNYSRRIKEIMKNRWLWGFTGILYTPEGVFFEDNPKTKDNQLIMNQNELENRLGSKQIRNVTFSDDLSVRFTPYGFKVKQQSSFELSRNPFIIAQTGSEERADKLAYVTNQHKNKSYLFALTKVKEPEARVSALDSDWGFDGGLDVGGDGDFGDDGYAFGIRKSAEDTL